MNYTIQFHPDVQSDLEIIAQIITEYSGFSTAERIVGQIEQAVTKLSDLPHIGSIRAEFPGKVRAIPVGRRGVVVFEVDDKSETVFVIAVTYGGADWMARTGARNYNLP